MTSKKSRPLQFLTELKRRKVYRASITYVSVAFIALQIIDLLIPTTNLPSWSDELLLAIAIMGFPVAVIAAWAFELSPDSKKISSLTSSVAVQIQYIILKIPNGGTSHEIGNGLLGTEVIGPPDFRSNA